MNYSLHYQNLIQKAKLRLIIDEYVEIHHIIPRKLGGSNDKSNLIKLTAREHFVAHRLLAKMYPNSGMVHAVWKMACCNNGKIIISSRTYQYLREEHAKRVSNDKTAAKKKSIALKGKKQSQEHIEARTASRKNNGKDWLSSETKIKISNSNRGKSSKRKGTKFTEEQMKAHFQGVDTRKKKGSYVWTDEQKRKASKSHKGKKHSKITTPEEIANLSIEKSKTKICPWCGVEMQCMIIHRWHFDKCPHKPKEIEHECKS